MSMRLLMTIGLVVWLCVIPVAIKGAQTDPAAQADEWTAARLLQAAQNEDDDDVRSAIAAGVDVNSKTAYGATALFFACDRGNESIVEILLAAGADPNTEDTFYKATPLTWAMQRGHKKIAARLLANGGKGADRFLLSAIESGDSEFATLIIATKAASALGLIKARDAAVRKSSDEKFKDLPALFASLELPANVPFDKPSPEILQRYVGKYQGSDMNVEVAVEAEELKLGFTPTSKAVLEPIGPDEFLLGTTGVQFQMADSKVEKLLLSFGAQNIELQPVDTSKMSKELTDAESNKKELEESEPANFGPSRKESLAADLAASSANWPSFRGKGARGVAEGQHPPIEWTVSADESENVHLKWKTPIPGLGLSCPSIWDNQIYLTSAVSDQADGSLKIGQYGSVDSVQEDIEFDFTVFCIDKNSGEVLWQRKATSGKPAVKRHAKSSHANPTVATNGQHVVAFFGNEGLYCYTADGDLIWEKKLGSLDSGWFYDPGYQWGFGSSPIIFGNQVIVQCDVQENSFVAAFELDSGTEVWRTEREEIPSWSTPTVHQFGELPMLVTHATKAARGYDARNGQLLWTLNKHSEVVVPTPFMAHNLIFIASGYSPIQPIYAIRPTARGDISVSETETTNEFISWSTKRGGPYMPTPIVYGDYLYCCSNAGILTCYFAETGAEVYKKRLSAPGGSLSFTASPLAADGNLYLTSEDGRVLVVEAGPEFKLIATNSCGESILATPAISDRTIYLRTQNSLIAVGE